MGHTDEPLPLRQRKKLRTREAIHRAAMQLFEVNGYVNTTVEQIAEMAEVSPSTFFRYFSSKQSVLMIDDIDQIAISGLASQPADISTMQAVRQAFEITRATLSKDEWEHEFRRRELVLSIPALANIQHEVHRRTAATMTEVECRRLGRDPDDFEVRVFFGALVGALSTALSVSGDLPEHVSRALAFVEAGLSLRHPNSGDP